MIDKNKIGALNLSISSGYMIASIFY